MVYLIKYELNKPGKNYDNLYAALRAYEYTKDDTLHSAWFVSTSWTADQISNDIRAHMDDNDKLIVTRLRSGEHQGWLSQGVWDWISPRL